MRLWTQDIVNYFSFLGCTLYYACRMVEIHENIASAFGPRKSRKELYTAVVDAPFRSMLPVELDLGAIVLLVTNEKTGCIERVALSKTASAEGAVNASAVPFHNISIPRDYEASAHVQALNSKKPVIVTDWHTLFTPVLSPLQSRDNQAGAGIACSIVSPYFGRRHEGTIIYSFYVTQEAITDAHWAFIEAYTRLVASVL